MEISSVSNYDYVCVVATYNQILNRRQKTSDVQLSNRGYSPEILSKLKIETEIKFQTFTSCGIKFSKPTDHFKYGQIGYLLTLFESFDKGILPFPGSLSEQPAQILELFLILHNVKHEFMNKQLGNKKNK